MSDRNDGGPAFPAEIDLEYYSAPSTRHEAGMSLRDYFAAKALQGFLAERSLPASEAGRLASDCYAMADAMLKARAE